MMKTELPISTKCRISLNDWEKDAKQKVQSNEKVWGLEHPTTATSYLRLAWIYLRENKYIEAEDLYKKAIHIREKVLGLEHHKTAESYFELAGLYEEWGKIEDVIALNIHGREIQLKAQKLKDFEILIFTEELTVLYECQGRYKEAAECYRKVIEKHQKSRSWASSWYDLLLRFYYGQGRYLEARELHKRAIKRLERHFGIENTWTAWGYYQFSLHYYFHGKLKYAERYFSKAEAVFLDRLGSNNQITQSVQMCLQVTREQLRKAHNKD